MLEESIMTATYTFDVFSRLDSFGSFGGGNWGGYWGKQGPELPHGFPPVSRVAAMTFPQLR